MIGPWDDDEEKEEEEEEFDEDDLPFLCARCGINEVEFRDDICEDCIEHEKNDQEKEEE